MRTLQRTRLHVEHAMGTAVTFRCHESVLDWVDVDGAVARACERLHALSAELTTWDATSAMSEVRFGTLDLADAPTSVRSVLEVCEEVRELSAGWFDPWALPGGVDPTGLAKGWILEEAMAVLRAEGVGAAVVNGGGDVCLMGVPEGHDWRWHVGIQHPWRPHAFACVLAATGAVATSGSYERGEHLFNPKTRRQSVASASATVVGPNLAVADGLATALAVGGDEVLERIEHLDCYDGYLIGLDGSEAATSGIEFVTDVAQRPS